MTTIARPSAPQTAHPGRATAPPRRVERIPGRWERVSRRIVTDPVMMAALIVLTVIVVCAIFRDHLMPYDPEATDLSRVLQGPSGDHLLGTDNLGRDTLSRLIDSSRLAMLASLEAAGIALLIGVPVGLVIGYVGGWLDNIVMRIVDGFTALPGLIVAIAVIAALGPGITNAMLALGLIFSTTFIRVTRGEVVSARRHVYVEAAQVGGAGTARILVRHVLPNIVGPLIVQLSLTLASALLAEAALSFIGLGAQPPEASWGVMVSEGGHLLARQPFLVIPPGVAIGLTVLCLNIVADGVLAGLRDEPRPRRLRRQNRGTAQTAVPASVVAPAVDPDILLDVRDLEVMVARPDGDLPLLDGVSLTVRRGETLGLVGESGSGKTMAALATMGLLPPSVHVVGGSVRLGGTELLGLSNKGWNEIRGNRMAMIFQEPSTALDPAFTVGDQITEVLRVHTGASRADARTRALYLLERVGIRDPQRRFDSYPHELSGGMAQRVMIALAISCDPELLIADEATTALDVTLKVQIADLLRDLQEEFGMGIIFVTHELGMVADLADTVAVMYAGQVVEMQPVADLMRSPRHPYTAALLESSSQGRPRGERLGTIPGTVPSPGSRPDGCRFAPRCTRSTASCTTALPPLEQGSDGAIRCVRPLNVEVRS
ncbi:dipeptide/oligopeptide/nickel ABC transporter permease/ATP-binding protein [Rhodococcus sp. NPDC058532]|uniref:dipeptide/oligopeptide/nickel ABC transporter permease/ATP-binding protein n=1 Tax=Rhodococcus sp. NPDC058532 TaxID=3346540 RepID=UPI003662D119